MRAEHIKVTTEATKNSLAESYAQNVCDALNADPTKHRDLQDFVLYFTTSNTSNDGYVGVGWDPINQQWIKYEHPVFGIRPHTRFVQIQEG